MVLSLWIGITSISFAAAAPADGFDKVEYSWAASMSKTAALRYRGDLWVVTPAADGLEITVGPDRGVITRTFRLDCDGNLGEVIGLSASTLESADQKFVAIGVASVQPGAEMIEYRLLQGRAYGDIHSEESWLYTEPLMTLPLSHPHQVMAVAMIGGDSIMMTVQTLKRIEGENHIETQTFVNHCPLALEEHKRVFRAVRYETSTDARAPAFNGDTRFVP